MHVFLNNYWSHCSENNSEVVLEGSTNTSIVIFPPGELGVQRVGEESSTPLSRCHYAGQLPHKPASHVSVQCCYNSSEQ